VLVHRVELSAENFCDHAGRLQKLSRPCHHLRTVRQDHISFIIAAAEELLAHALSIIMRPQRDGDVPEGVKDAKLHRW
jgi:hypothetical protein